MNANCPSDYIEASAKSSLDDTATLIAYIRALTPSPKTALVQPIITPRFAISCTSELLTGLGQLAAAEEAAGSPVAIQTHLAENTGEIAFTKELFADIGGEWDGSYTGVYEHFGLLGPRTVLAHCVSGIQILVTPCLALTTAASFLAQVHLEDEELELIKRTSSGVSHCPASNFNLRSGIAKVAKMLDREIKVGPLVSRIGDAFATNPTYLQVGLGTDCSGGYEMGIVSQMRTAILGSKAIKFDTSAPTPTADDGSFAGASHLPLSAVFHMATLGGASLVGLDGTVGSFEAGKEWDALLIDVNSRRGTPAMWFDAEEEADEAWEESAFERFVRPSHAIHKCSDGC